MNILHLVSLMGMGGRCATALRQIRLLVQRGHHVVVGCIRDSAAATRAKDAGATVCDGFQFRRGLRVGALWNDFHLLRRICREHRIDIVHAHLSQESWLACLGAPLCSPRPAVVRSRGVVVPIQPHAFNRWMHNRLTDRVIVPSHAICDKLRALPGFDPKRVTLLADGVDIERFSPKANGAALRAEFGIAPDAPLAVMVARLERVKGHAFFFEALAKLLASKTVPGLRALCACDERTPGEYARAIAHARGVGLGEEVLSFTGMRQDVENVVAAATVIALPSLGSEGSSRVGLEAAACGVPVVASRVGCLPEVIEHGKTGLIVPPGDAEALSIALGELLRDPAKARAMGAAARERAEALYDERTMIEGLERVYAEVRR